MSFRGGKRGSRLGWREADGITPTVRKLIRHTTKPGAICWEEIPEGECPETEEEPVKKRPLAAPGDLLKLLSASKTYRRPAVESLATTAGIGRARCRELIAELIDAGELHEHTKARHHARPEILLARFKTTYEKAA